MKRFLALAFFTLALAPAVSAQTNADTPTGAPAATIDLATREGAQLVKGQWRYSDTKIIEVDFRGPGADNQPTGAPLKTYDYTPHADGADFDDSPWAVLDPTTLGQRRATGRLCFNWYRIRVTIPERIGDFDHIDKSSAGAKVVEAALEGRSYWHFASHGKFEPTDARESGLIVRDEETLKIGRLLDTKDKLGRARVAVLSACVTPLPGGGRTL